MKNKKLTLKAIDYHRNGVSGLGFYVLIVNDQSDDEPLDMLVVRFPKEADHETGNVVCAAFDLGKLDQREIRFFHNSYRGDWYSDFADAEIAKFNERLTAKEARNG